MAGKRTSSADALEAKIAKAEERVVRTKAQYDAATQELKDLLDKKSALQRDELVKLIMKSTKSYEEIKKFFEEENETGEGEKKENRHHKGALVGKNQEVNTKIFTGLFSIKI